MSTFREVLESSDDYRITLFGGAGYVIENSDGLMWRAYGDGWTSHDYNAAIFDSKEDAQRILRTKVIKWDQENW